MSGAAVTRRRMLWLAAGTATAATASTARAPNIIYITSDQQRYDEMSSSGNEHAHTPHLDRMAAEGLRATRAFAQYPVCLPSRVSMMTGRYPHAHGVLGNKDTPRRGEILLWEHLRPLGYHTVGVGKIEMGSSASLGEHYAFKASTPENFRLLRDVDRTRSSAIFPGDEERHWDFRALRQAQKILRENRDRPQFIYLSFHQPHRVIAPPARFARKYEGKDMPLPPSFETGFANRTEAFKRGCLKQGWDKLSREEVQTLIARRLASCEMLDYLVGEVRGTIEELGLTDDTVLAYQSDHGDYAGEYHCINKTPLSLSDGLLRVPLVLWAPGRLKSPGPIEDFVEEVDVLPTLLDLAGLPHPPKVQGRSLLRLIAGQDQPRDAVFAQLGDAFMIHTGRWKLVSVERGESELYDLREDPGEIRNIFGTRPKVEGDLRARLRRWRESTGRAAPA